MVIFCIFVLAVHHRALFLNLNFVQQFTSCLNNRGNELLGITVVIMTLIKNSKQLWYRNKKKCDSAGLQNKLELHLVDTYNNSYKLFDTTHSKLNCRVRKIVSHQILTKLANCQFFPKFL